MENMDKINFVHLHVHSHYSLLDGLGTPEQIVLRAKEMGMDSVAITDHGSMYGAIEFYKAAKAAEIKPIVGCEMYVSPRSMTEKVSKLDSSPYHLILLAKNLEGYINLMKITSLGHLEGFYYKPRIDKEHLKKLSKGLIATSACIAGEIPRMLLGNDEESAKRVLGEYKEIFGDDFYLELQDHPEIREQGIANEKLIKLAKETNTPLTVACDAHYIRTSDHGAHDVLICVQTGKTVDDPNRMTYDGDFSLRDPKELAEAFKEVPEALENTQKIADMCNLEIPFEENLLPTFKIESDQTPDEYLREQCLKGLPERYPQATDEEKKGLMERLDYELGVIMKMGFSSYFLIVADYVRWSKENRIMVGPGRGSAAGALVTYLTYITDVDPIRYGLLFERFLNPDRLEMPDIDLDFADHRRAEVLGYITEKYGEEHVAGIVTFGTMAARAAVRDVGRALGMPYAEVDQISKVVPPPVQGRHIPLEKSVKDSPELREFYTKDPKAKRLLDMAMKLEGTVRHAGQHASAFVITEDPLVCYVPLQQGQKEGVSQVTQYSMYPVAELGLLKMDFLGLSNLTTVERALDIIEAVHGTKIDIFNLPVDDTKTFQLLGRGEGVGVFQFESSGMRRYIKELKPTSIDDVAVMVALYRPGPMQFIDTFIARKNGKEAITFPHEMTKKALEVTYGIPVYQEQVMQISKDMAGFTGGEADKLRKAMGKKIAKLMAEMKVKFIKGSIKSGVKEKDAEKVFSMLEDFAAYGFNKSHAVCYAMIAYQTAYLKAHHPECFMAALLTSDLDDIDRIAIEIDECERMGLKVLPPDINESFVDFGVVKETGNIRFGLAAIKGIGETPGRIITRERKKNGPFKSLEDFVDRMIKTEVSDQPSPARSASSTADAGGAVSHQDKNQDETKSQNQRSVLNKRILESLAKSGALDLFAERNQIISGMEIITKRIQESQKVKKTSQIGLFGEVLSADIELGKLELPEVEPVERVQKLAWEKEHLGIYISEHPLKEVGGMLRSVSSHKITDLTLTMEGRRVKIGGIITTLKKINTRSGQLMAFAGLEDLSGKTEVLVFPKILEETSELWIADKLVVVSGKISTKDGEIKILADKVEGFDPDNPPAGGGKTTMVTVSDADEIVEIDLSSEPEVTSTEAELREVYDKGEYVLEKNKEVYIILPAGTDKEKLLELKGIFERNAGERLVILAYKKDGHFEFKRTKVQVSASIEFSEELKKILT